MSKANNRGEYNGLHLVKKRRAVESTRNHELRLVSIDSAQASRANKRLQLRSGGLIGCGSGMSMLAVPSDHEEISSDGESEIEIRERWMLHWLGDPEPCEVDEGSAPGVPRRGEYRLGVNREEETFNRFKDQADGFFNEEN